MINSQNYPYLNIEFGSQDLELNAYVDTGFRGFLFIPEKYEEILGEPDTYTPIRLAGGKRELAPLYYKRIVKVYGIDKSGIAKKSNKIEEKGDVICYGKGSYLIGREFLDKFEVYLEKNIEITINYGVVGKAEKIGAI